MCCVCNVQSATSQPTSAKHFTALLSQVRACLYMLWSVRHNAAMQLLWASSTGVDSMFTQGVCAPLSMLCLQPTAPLATAPKPPATIPSPAQVRLPASPLRI